ncbi:hypothetical protein [Burkholderia cenocepacia]|uniref:hypothetical protein n=1 Tax=Burkholderia cenocepacia TaxID=95486 RepID=UPI0022388664|nr:hypothetical protein [Burkholderia cenocepacia]MCW5156351.1 hypothetical protein [Burkholderia cenocepacia]
MAESPGAKNIIEDSAISWLAPFYFITPYRWLWTFVSRVGAWSGSICGHSAGGKFAGFILQIIMILIVMAFIMIPVCLYWRFATFWVASIIRLVRGVGGKQGLTQNLSFVGFYFFVFAFVYVPWVIPWTFGYISWDSILQRLNII